jgi:hypothetical protein
MWVKGLVETKLSSWLELMKFPFECSGFAEEFKNHSTHVLESTE